MTDLIILLSACVLCIVVGWLMHAALVTDGSIIRRDVPESERVMMQP